MTDDPAGGAGRGPDPVDVLLAEVARGLRGPARRRRDLLAEMRDGLDDATDAHLERGLSPAQARRAACTDFGDPEVVRAACQRELAAAHALRVAAVMCVVVPGVDQLWGWWYPAMRSQAVDVPARDPGAFAILPTAQAVLVWLVAAVAFRQILLIRRGCDGSAPTVVAALAALVVVLVGGSSALMIALDGGETIHVVAHSLRGFVLEWVSALMLSVMAVLAWRTARIARLAR